MLQGSAARPAEVAASSPTSMYTGSFPPSPYDTPSAAGSLAPSRSSSRPGSRPGSAKPRQSPMRWAAKRNDAIRRAEEKRRDISDPPPHATLHPALVESPLWRGAPGSVHRSELSLTSVHSSPSLLPASVGSAHRGAGRHGPRSVAAAPVGIITGGGGGGGRAYPPVPSWKAAPAFSAAPRELPIETPNVDRQLEETERLVKASYMELSRERLASTEQRITDAAALQGAKEEASLAARKAREWEMRAFAAEARLSAVFGEQAKGVRKEEARIAMRLEGQRDKLAAEVRKVRSDAEHESLLQMAESKLMGTETKVRAPSEQARSAREPAGQPASERERERSCEHKHDRRPRISFRCSLFPCPFCPAHA